jgi:hypothetical protein
VIQSRRLVAVLVSTLAAAAGAAGMFAAAPPARAASAAKVCAVPKGAKVSLKRSTGVVYSVRKRKRSSGPGRAWFACSKVVGKRVSLGFVADEPCTDLDSVERPTIAGRYLAFVTTTSDCTGQSGNADVHLVDLNTARAVAAVGATTSSEPSSVSVTALALRADGALAFITNVDNDYTPIKPWWVYAGDAAGVRALDSSDQPLTGLTLTDTTAAWTNNGQPKSAPLGPGPSTYGN